MGFAAGFAAGTNMVAKGYAIRDNRDQRKLEEEGRGREDVFRQKYADTLRSSAGIPDPADGATQTEAVTTGDGTVTPTPTIGETAIEGQPDVSTTNIDPYADVGTRPGELQADGVKAAMPEEPVSKTAPMTPAQEVYGTFNTLTPTYQDHINNEIAMIQNLPYGSTFTDIQNVSKFNQSQREKYFITSLDGAKRALESGNLERTAGELRKMYSAMPDGNTVQVRRMNGQLAVVQTDEETGEIVGQPAVVSVDMLEKLQEKIISNPEMLGNFDLQAMHERRLKNITIDMQLKRIDQLDQVISASKSQVSMAIAKNNREAELHPENKKRLEAENKKIHLEMQNTVYTQQLAWLVEGLSNNSFADGAISRMGKKDRDDLNKRTSTFLQKERTEYNAVNSVQAKSYGGLGGPDTQPPGWTKSKFNLYGTKKFGNYARNSHEIAMYNDIDPSTASDVAAEFLGNPVDEDILNGGQDTIVKDVIGRPGVESYRLHLDPSLKEFPSGVGMEMNGYKYTLPPGMGSRPTKAAFQNKVQGSYIGVEGLPFSNFEYGMHDANGKYADGNITTDGQPIVSQAEKAATEEGKKLGAAKETVSQAQSRGALADPQEAEKMVSQLGTFIGMQKQAGTFTAPVAGQILQNIQSGIDRSALSQSVTEQLEAYIAELEQVNQGGQASPQGVPVQ